MSQCCWLVRCNINTLSQDGNKLHKSKTPYASHIHIPLVTETYHLNSCVLIPPTDI